MAVAFTFDDGPDPVYTTQLMELFREHGGKATFFVVGQELERHPDVAKALHEAGHELGNHTYSHPHLPELDEAGRMEELDRTDALILALTGAKPASYRAPYLHTDERLDALALERGYASAGGSNLDARDWSMPGADHIVDATRPALRPGAVILLHDGAGDRSQTVEAVRRLLPEAIAQGLELVTFGELVRSAASGSEG
jgi:peptidoglycan/xylan/chitin deacetylase (PgdA/CDA1 family)